LCSTELIAAAITPRYHEALSRVLPIAKTILKKHLLRITRKADLEMKAKAAEDALALFNEKVTRKLELASAPC
jgi:polyphosphate kinase